MDIFKNYKDEVKNQTIKRIKNIRSDHGDEYYGRYDGFRSRCLGHFAKFLKEYGIIP